MRAFINTLVAAAALSSTAYAAPRVIASDTVLDGPQAGGVVVTADGVTLDCAQHPVQGDGTDAIGIEVRGDDVTLSNCVVDQFAEAGISARSVERLTLRNVAASRVDIGLLVEGGAGHTLDAVYVAASRIGVTMLDVRGSTAVGVTVDSPSARGVVLSGVVESDLVGARVLRAGGRGITVTGGYGVTVRDSEVLESGGIGISVTAAARTRIEDCNVRWSGGDGIRLTQTSLAVVNRNESLANGEAGLVVAGSIGATMEDNVTASNQLAGLVLKHSKATTASGRDSQNEVRVVRNDLDGPGLSALEE